MCTSGFGKKNGRPAPSPAEVDLEERLDEALRLGQVVRVRLAGVLAAGADRRHRLEVLRRLPVEVDVREDRLPAARDRLLRVLVDQDLGQLAHLAVGEADEKRREEDVHGVPADGAGEVALQRRRELHHVREQHLGVARRLRDRERVREVQAELLHVLERLPRAVGAVDEAQVVQVQVPARVRVGDLRGEDPQQRVLLLDVLGERQVGRLGAVRDVRVLLVRREQQLLDVVERHAEPGVQPARALEAVLEQLGVDELADQRRGQGAGVEGADLLLDLAADQPGGLLVEERLAHQRLDDALAGEVHHPLRGGAHEQRAVGGLLRDRFRHFQNARLISVRPCDQAPRCDLRPFPEDSHENGHILGQAAEQGTISCVDNGKQQEKISPDK